MSDSITYSACRISTVRSLWKRLDNSSPLIAAGRSNNVLLSMTFKFSCIVRSTNHAMQTNWQFSSVVVSWMAVSWPAGALRQPPAFPGGR